MDYGMPTGEIRACESCGCDFDVLEGARNHRYCSTECWAAAQEEREHETYERGRAAGRRELRADLEAAEARGYQQGHEDGWKVGNAAGLQQALRNVIRELERNLERFCSEEETVPPSDWSN